MIVSSALKHSKFKCVEMHAQNNADQERHIQIDTQIERGTERHKLTEKR